jgi:hypothetical protein
VTELNDSEVRGAASSNGVRTLHWPRGGRERGGEGGRVAASWPAEEREKEGGGSGGSTLSGG